MPILNIVYTVYYTLLAISPSPGYKESDTPQNKRNQSSIIGDYMNTFEMLHGATHSPQQAISVKQNTRQAALTIFLLFYFM